MSCSRIIRDGLSVGAILFLATLANPVHAQLTANPASVDFGRHRQEQVASQVVKLTNVGAKPLEIISTQSDCSCAAVTAGKLNLAPGESTSLEIKMETRRYEGVIRRSVRIQTSEGERVIPVQITVFMYENWTVTPTYVVLPPSQRGREAVAQVALTYDGPGKIDLEKITASPAYVDAESTSADGKKFNLTLKKRSGAPAGNHTVSVVVATSDPSVHQLTLNVFVPVASTLLIAPNPIVLPTVKLGQRAVREVSLRGWTGGIAPRFELSQGETRIRGQSGDSFELEVAVTPVKPGPSTQLLRIYSGETLEAEIPVILRAEPADPAK